MGRTPRKPTPALAIALLALGGTARAQNAMTGVSSTARATFESIGVVASISGDANGNGSAALEVRKTTGAFVAAHPLSRVDPDRFIGSAFLLDPDTDYEVRVTLSDPDGVTNGVLTAQARTRSNVFPPASGTDYYVSPTGSDSNPGTQALPFRTVGHAASVVQPGDEAILRAGTYYESVDITTPGGSATPIVFRAFTGETAILDGADPALVNSPGSWTNQGGGVWSVPLPSGTSYVAVDNNRLYRYGTLAELQGLTWGTDGGFYAGGGLCYVRFPGGGTPTGVSTYVSRYAQAFNADGMTDLRFEDLEIRHYGLDDTSKGVYLRYASRCVIDGCAIHHNISGVGLKGDASDNVIQNCVFYDTPAETWDWDASKAAGNVEAGGVVIYDPHTGQGNVIRWNDFHDFFDGSHFCGGSDTVPDETDIYENSFQRCNDDGFETDGWCIDTRIWGNTFKDTLMGVSLAAAVHGPTYVFQNLILDYGNTVSGSQFTGAPFKFNVSGMPPSGPMFLYHNTCSSGTPGTDAWLIKDLSNWDRLTSRNNIFAANDYGYRYDNSANDPIDIDYDLIYTSTPNRFANVQGTFYATLADFQTGTGLDLQGLSAPPQFQNPAAGDLTLSAGSPAIDAGLPIPGVDDGYVGAAPDMGAFEYGSGAPAAQFSGTPLVGPAPLAVQFTDLSTGTVTSWSWTFGDGGTSTSQSPAHTYGSVGSYDVSLTVTGPGGSDTETKPGYVVVTGGGPQSNYVTGRGRGFPNPNDVRIHKLGTVAAQASFNAYAAGQWGTLVAAADIDGSGLANPLTGPGPGAVYGPQVRAFQPNGIAIGKVNFYAYGTLRFGVNVAGAAIDGDGPAEILSGAGPGAVFGPHVRGFNYDGATLTPIAKVSFFAYATLKYGVNVSEADLDLDGYQEILTGAGPSAAFGAQVRGFNFDGATVTGMGKVSFFAFTSASHGCNPAGGDVDGDSFEEIAAGRGPGPSQAAQALGFDYDGNAVAALAGFDVTPYGTTRGARVATGDVDGDGRAELVTGPGEDPAATASVRTFRYTGSALPPVTAGSFDAFTVSPYGAIVGAGICGY